MSHAFLGAQNSFTRVQQRGQDPQRSPSSPVDSSDLDDIQENGSILLTVESADGATFKLKVSQLTTGLEIKRVLERSTGTSPTDMKLVFVNPTTNHREVFNNSMTLRAADFDILEKHDGESDLEPPFHLKLYFRDRNGQFTEETGVEYLSETDLTSVTDRSTRSNANSAPLIQPPVAVKYHNEPKDRPNDNLRDQSLML